MCTRATSDFTAMILWAFATLVVCASFVQAVKPGPIQVDIEPKDSVLGQVGKSLRIMCRVGPPIQTCRVEIPGETGMILTPNQVAEDGIKYFGDGLNTGQCGVHISEIKETYNGVFKCFLTPTDARSENQAQVRIIVAKPPHDPELILSSGLYGRNIYKKGDKLEISCSASGGRPAANVSLYLDDELISGEERPTIYDSNVDDNSLAVQNVSRTLDWTDHGKVVRCLASHIALDQPKETKQQLQVFYPPQPQATIERFGYVIGRQGIVNVTVHANPRPRFLWRVNDEPITEGRPDKSNRLETSTAVDLGKGAWNLILRIDSVQKSDTEKEYILEAHNDEGTFEYRVVLSTSTEPAGVDLDAGSIIGIVVGVLVLLLVVFLVVFARATGRWCFAGGSSTRYIGESDLSDPAASVSLLRFHKPKTDDTNGRRSDTESAGRYSRNEVDSAIPARRPRPKINLSQLFKRNKDKVSGADTDTGKTVVTVDDEKLQTAEPITNVMGTTAPTTGEGGIVYAELDLTRQQQGITPRRINDDKTEYAEILYTKPEEEIPTTDK